MHHSALKIIHEHPDFLVRILPSACVGGPLSITPETLHACVIDVFEGKESVSEQAFYKITKWHRRKFAVSLRGYGPVTRCQDGSEVIHRSVK